jgi:4-diphosphocytidyl-2-C-methyl-D-erythritol kinase
MVPRKVGTAWEVQAPAKLNLYLEVLGRRTDGFHELETLLVSVHLFDDLRWAPAHESAPDCTLTIRNQLAPAITLSNTGTLSNTDNLVLRAARVLAQRAGIQPHGHLELTKRIPLQAGLGGGSSDAAATLRLVNAAWGTPLSESILVEIAAELGSDVPFFLAQGPAVCRGHGELIETVGPLPRLNLVIVKPALGMSTPEVFRELGMTAPPTTGERQQSAHRLRGLLAALRAGAIARACAHMTNRLEAVAVRLAPEIAKIKTALARAGCCGQFMTGSGSTVVGIARSAIQARRIAQTLSAQNFGTVLATASAW